MEEYETIDEIDETLEVFVDTDESLRNYWTGAKTSLLLNLYGERIQKFRDPKVKKKTVWREIVDEMELNGYFGMTEDALDRKMPNMKKTYMTIKDNNNKTGRCRKSWPYFDQMEDIFSIDRTVNPGFTISPIETNDDSVSHIYSVNSIASAPSSPLIPDSPQMPSPSPASKNSASYRQRKEFLELERKRIAAIEQMDSRLSESIQVQKERNEI